MTEWVRYTDDFAWHLVEVEIERFVEDEQAYRMVHSVCGEVIDEEDPEAFLTVGSPDELPAIATDQFFAGYEFSVCPECLAA